jgi:hypothetical protein
VYLCCPRSDFACCPPDQHHGYPQNAYGSKTGRIMAMLSSISIGTCDWTIIYVDADGPPDISSNIVGLGTAWAT